MNNSCFYFIKKKAIVREGEGLTYTDSFLSFAYNGGFMSFD
jgi:hypothetical protein